MFKKGDLLGGKKPGTRNRTTLALQAEFRALVNPKMEKFVGILDGMTDERLPGELCPLCGNGMPRPEEVRQKAIGMLWDRSGLHPRVEVEITEQPDIAWMQYFTDDQLETLSAWIEEARKQVPIGAPLLLEEGSGAQ